MQHPVDQKNEGADERPPVFGSWGIFYGAVVAWLAVLILFFYFFTRFFSA